MNKVSPSQAASWACPQRWLFAYGFEVEPAHVESEAMNVGLAVHKLLEDPGYEPGFLENQDAFAQAKAIIARYNKHWASQLSGFAILSREVDLEATIGPDGKSKTAAHNSPCWAGRADGIAQSARGELWVWEVKTTSHDLARWVVEHSLDPQVMIYGYMLQYQTGRPVVGAVYDLIKTGTCHSADEISVRKPRPGTLPQTTADAWAQASGLGEPWHQEVHRALLAREANGYWFMRLPMRWDGLRRTWMEMRALGFELSKRWRQTADYRSSIANAPTPASRGKVMKEGLERLGHEFPRQWAMCWQHNRPCPYMQACSTWDEGVLAELGPRERHTGGKDETAGSILNRLV